MAYLIDGNNLLGHISAYALKDKGGRASLIGRLLSFQRMTGKRIHLVFDGRPPGDETRIEVNSKFTILYPEPGGNADLLIKERIGNQNDKRHFFVVTTDRDLRDFAKAHGVKSLTCLEFNRELKKVLREYGREKEMEKTFTFPSPLEVNLWKDVFRDKKR